MKTGIVTRLIIKAFNSDPLLLLFSFKLLSHVLIESQFKTAFAYAYLLVKIGFSNFINSEFLLNHIQPALQYTSTSDYADNSTVNHQITLK